MLIRYYVETDSLEFWLDQKAHVTELARHEILRKPDSTDIQINSTDNVTSVIWDPVHSTRIANRTRSETSKKPVGLRSIPGLNQPADITVPTPRPPRAPSNVPCENGVEEDMRKVYAI